MEYLDGEPFAALINAACNVASLPIDKEEYGNMIDEPTRTAARSFLTRLFNDFWHPDPAYPPDDDEDPE